MGAVASPALMPFPKPRTPPVSGPWQDAPTVIARVTFDAGPFAGVRAATVIARPAKAPKARKVKPTPTPAELLAAELAKPGKAGPARAAKIRALKLAACGCVLCGWAISPAATLAEHEARGAECERRNAAGDWPACRNRPPVHPDGVGPWAPAPAGFDGDAYGPREGDGPTWSPVGERRADGVLVTDSSAAHEAAELELRGQTKAEIDAEGKATA